MFQDMSREEKVSLLSGQDTWTVAPVERLGIPSLVMSDGPAGVRGQSFMSGRSVSFPCPTALAATWDPELVGEVGRALGAEARREGVHVLLAPTVNLHRHPLAGRNFECFSEDPELTSEMACAYINGVQSQGVACCIKHFVGNDSEYERHTISSEIDETTLRELYLRPFEAAVTRGVWSVMASYNRLNGTHTSEHPWLLGQVLRDEWGFDGAVVSDWFGSQSTVEALVAGLDIEMPGPPRYRGDALLEAMKDGTVPEAAVDRAVERVLRLIGRTASGQTPAQVPDNLSALVRKAAARAVVLLKNDGVLPLQPGTLKTVALIGPGADVGTFQGGGSAHVNPAAVAGILPALNDALGPGVEVRFERGCLTREWPHPLTAPLVDGLAVQYVDRVTGQPVGEGLNPRSLQLTWIGELVPGRSNDDVTVRVQATLQPIETGRHELIASGTGTVRLAVDGHALPDAAVELEAGVATSLTIEFETARHRGLSRLEVDVLPPDPPDLLDRAVALASRADAVVVVAGSPPGWESEGRDRDSLTLPGGQDALIERVCAANPRTAVVVNTGAPVTMPWAEQAGALLQMWLPGQEMGRALADVLTGAVNPAGRLPTTFWRQQDDVPSDPWYPGGDGRVAYGEGLFMGYRHQGAQPRFPFGHGLSYTTFVFGQPAVSSTDNGFQIAVPVSHAGGPVGRQVVQVYVASGWDDRPLRELKGFDPVEVGPGETVMARVAVPGEKLRWWRDGRWVTPPGPLRAWVGTSATDLPFTVELPKV
jgi:beta-glucosidase